MPIPVRPTREHWGEWSNYIGRVLVEKLKDSTLKYLSKVDDNNIIYGIMEEPPSYPNIYVFAVTEPGSTPTTSGDIIEYSMTFRIAVEDMGLDIAETDDDLRNILGDIIALLLLDRTLTYNSLPTCRDLRVNTIDSVYQPPFEDGEIMRWHLLEIVVNKRLNMNTVTE